MAEEGTAQEVAAGCVGCLGILVLGAVLGVCAYVAMEEPGRMGTTPEVAGEVVRRDLEEQGAEPRIPFEITDAEGFRTLFRDIRDAGLPCGRVVQAVNLGTRPGGHVHFSAHCSDRNAYKIIWRGMEAQTVEPLETPFPVTVPGTQNLLLAAILIGGFPCGGITEASCLGPRTGGVAYSARCSNGAEYIVLDAGTDDFPVTPAEDRQ